jgi:DnaJ-class molecular chaperone
MRKKAKTEPCAYCNGTGVKGPPTFSYDCPDCRGTGVLTAERKTQIEESERLYGRSRL